MSVRFSLEAPRRDGHEIEADTEGESDDCNDLVSREIIKELNSSIGILSLTQNNESLLMGHTMQINTKVHLSSLTTPTVFFAGP